MLLELTYIRLLADEGIDVVEMLHLKLSTVIPSFVYIVVVYVTGMCYSWSFLCSTRTNVTLY